MRLTCTRIYAAADGLSHFGSLDLELKESRIGPRIPPLGATAPMPAETYYFLTFPPGIFMDWHPAPRRLLHLFLAGQCEVAVADGEVRTFGAGDIVLAEDRTGQGHTTRNKWPETTLMAVVALPD